MILFRTSCDYFAMVSSSPPSTSPPTAIHTQTSPAPKSIQPPSKNPSNSPVPSAVPQSSPQQAFHNTHRYAPVSKRFARLVICRDQRKIYIADKLISYAGYLCVCGKYSVVCVFHCCTCLSCVLFALSL